MSPEKIFITGGTGFIGSHLVRKLFKDKYPLVIFTRENSSTKFIKPYLERGNVKLVRGNFQSVGDLENAMKDCQVVFHNAGFVADWGPKKKFYQVNVQGTENVLKAAKYNNINYFVLSSSTAVLGEENCLKAKSEEAEYKPNYPYLLSNIFPSAMNYYRDTKMLAEKKAIEFCSEANIDLTVVRPVWVYGPREFHAGPYYFAKSVSEGNRFFPASENVKFHTIYVEDLVEVMLRLLKKKPLGIKVFNIGSKEIHTLKEFWGEFCKNLGRGKPTYPPKWLIYPVGLSMEILATLLKTKEAPLLTRARVCMGYSNNIYNTSKIREELGHLQETSLSRGVEKTVRWWRINKYL